MERYGFGEVEKDKDTVFAEAFTEGILLVRRTVELHNKLQDQQVGNEFVAFLKTQKQIINRNIHEAQAFDIFLQRANDEEELENLEASVRDADERMHYYSGQLVQVTYREDVAFNRTFEHPHAITAQLRGASIFDAAVVLGLRTPAILNGQNTIGFHQVKFLDPESLERLIDVRFLSELQQAEFLAPTIMH